MYSYSLLIVTVDVKIDRGRGLIRWFKNKNYSTEMNNEQVLRFPGNFPGKSEQMRLFPS